mmetsp:Transcript_4856/g.8674  ORF Transcript_4856/g.8674 Transcript_4856/m.8674 type:complete len:486 (-) Transcript_4856:93-1550(-)
MPSVWRALASLLVACAWASPKADLKRARQKIPREQWRGHDFQSMNARLNAQLRSSGHCLQDCSQWTTPELQQLLRQISKAAEKELLAVYAAAGDPRHQRFSSTAELENHWAFLDAGVDDEIVEEMRRDGLCHEAVMWWVHHLSGETQQKLSAKGVKIPSLPERLHAAPGGEAHAVYKEYQHQVSCQQCHTGKIAQPEWQNATLPKPLPEDKTHPGRERQRACDYQNQPPCGPCEGLGGRRWADDPEAMTPIPCEVIHGPELPATTKGRYPAQATARLTGETRTPIEVIPTKPGKYIPIRGNLSLGWAGELMRMRYDFEGLGAEISAQTLQQAQEEDVGATIHQGGGQCACTPSIAGIMHIHSFEASDSLDPLKLPPEEGGVRYMGRVRVVLDGDNPETNNVTAIADHYMKWAFHFLVDADEDSPSFGLPLRLYGATGVRQVFDSWQLCDPSASHPQIWNLPTGCKVIAAACSVFKNASTQPSIVI